MTCNLRVEGNCTKPPNMWEISKCYFAVLYAAQSQIYIPNFLLQYKKLSHAICKEEREKQRHLVFTLNYILL